MYKKILVPTDASEYSLRALKAAEKLAVAFNASLLVINAIQKVEFFNKMESYGVVLTDEELIKHGENAVDKTLETLEADIPVEKKIVIGHPVNVILKIAEEDEDIDLIVMGSQGHGPIFGSVMGSVSQRVLHHAKCPVMIVK